MYDIVLGLVVAAVVIRWATVPEQQPGGVRFSLPDAPNGPPNQMFPPATSSGCGYFCGGPGDGPGNQGDEQGDPPPLPPGTGDGSAGPGGPEDSPPEDPPTEEDCE